MHAALTGGMETEIHKSIGLNFIRHTLSRLICCTVYFCTSEVVLYSRSLFYLKTYETLKTGRNVGIER